MEKFKSFYPPVCIKGAVSNRYYLILDGVWNEVQRYYSWNELQPLWEKISYSKPKSIAKPLKKEYKVKGSKGNIYKVVNDAGIWNCSCPAHGFGRGKDCKHIIALKTKK